MTTATVEQLPIPTVDTLPSAYDEIGALARVLSREWNDDAYARLNARVAAMYQLTVEEFQYVLGTFPLVSSSARDAVLRVFRRERVGGAG